MDNDNLTIKRNLQNEIRKLQLKPRAQHIITWVYTCNIIVSDDDSTMKSNLKQSFAEKVEKGIMKIDEWPRTKKKLKSDNGRLPLDIPEPRFLADFNHCVKTVGKSVYALALLPKKESDVSKELAAQMKTCRGMMLKQIRYLHWEKESEKIKQKVLAPVEHLFNDHKYCDAEWCYVLKADKENKPYTPDSSRPMYSKISHKKMYDQLTHAVERFQTEDNVKECLHKYDTQHNEGLNMSVSCYVPKFKHYMAPLCLLIQR